MGFYINLDPSAVMKIIEFKNRIKDKINVGVELNKKNSMDADLQQLINQLDELEHTWQEQMGLHG